MRLDHNIMRVDWIEFEVDTSFLVAKSREVAGVALKALLFSADNAGTQRMLTASRSFVRLVWTLLLLSIEMVVWSSSRHQRSWRSSRRSYCRIFPGSEGTCDGQPLPEQHTNDVRDSSAR